MKQTVEPLNASELRWLEANLQRLRDFGQKEAKHVFSLAELDELYRKWRSGRREKEDPNPMINSFGTAFGQQFVDQLSMTWSVVSDDNGTEMAVTSQPGNIMVFPPNFVGKRYPDGATDFFESGFRAMSKDIAEMRAQWVKKPWWKIW